MKRKLLFAIVALMCSVGVWAETDYTSLMPTDWTINATNPGNFQSGKEAYNTSNYSAGKIIYQSFTAPSTGIYEIKFYAVTSSTSGRGFDNIFGDNIAQAYASAGSNKTTLAMTVINQTGCTLAQDANIRTLSVEAAQGETIEYGLENIATGGNWYTIQNISAKMKTVAEIYQAQYDEAYAIWEHSTENETGAKATFKTYVDAMNTALTGTLAEAQTASDNLAAALVTYESKSYPVKGSGVKYDFTSKMNMAINAWTCAQGNGPAQYGFTGATETYKGSVMNNGDVMHQTITGLANGEYEIHFYAVANSPRNESAYGADKATVYANEVELPVEVYAQDGCTPSDYERTLTVMVTDGSITYGIKCNGGGNWYVCKNVALYMTGAPDLSDYYDAISANLTTANGLLSSKMGPTASSGLTTAISDAAGYDNITVIGTLETINQNIVDAISAANTSIADYANLAAAITAAGNKYSPLAANAAAYNTSISDAQTVYNNATVDDCAATIANLNTAFQTANVADFNYVQTTYPYAVNLGTWSKVNAVDRSSQHWDGTSASTYSEQDEGWGKNSWECSYSQNLALPAGKYVFKVAGRKSSNSATLTLEVKNGTTTIGTVSNFPDGDTGYGINKKGDASFDSDDAEGFAKNPNHTGDDLEGCGWQWRFVEFELSDPATVNVAVKGSASAQYQWVGFCNATVQTDDADNVALMQALVALNDAKAAATLTQHTNVGTGVFQYEATNDDNLWSAYSTAKSNAEAFTLAANTEVEEVTALTTALTTAQANYSSNAVINAPDASKRYNVSIVDDGQAWDGNAITFIAGGRTDMGNFAVQYLASANAYMCQALKFTAVEGEDNTYKISAIRADGGEQYLTTGSTYEGGNNTQIRTTDDVSKASWVKIQPAATSGQFQLLNVSDGNKVIGRNATNPDNGMYTDGNVSFTIAEASQASVTVSCKADKFGTTIVPFTVDITEFSGIKFYTVESVNATTGKVQLTDVTTLAANVPYLIKNEGGENFSKDITGWGTATADSYTEGLLTGVYTEATVPVNSYVLQTQNDVQAFYKVDAAFTATAYKCYLTVTSSQVKAFFLDFGGEDAINGIEAETENAEIFNLAGQRVNKAQKGIYIVNGKKVLVK